MRLAEEVHASQPNLFFAVLVLQRYQATVEQIEVVLNLLLVFHEAMADVYSTDVLLSHGAKDSDAVREVRRRFQSDGLRVWALRTQGRPGLPRAWSARLQGGSSVIE